MEENTGSKPVPDPTLLTTQQLLRELGLLREILETRIDGLQEVLDTRLGANDRAVDLIQRRADKIPSETDLAIARLKELHEEKFRSVRESLAEIKLGMTRETESISSAISALTTTTNAKIDDIKTRLTVIEGRM